MAELSVDDLIGYTGERLLDTDETARLLGSALAAARRYCGWHVTPVRVDEQVTVDGPGSDLLVLPTLRLLALTSVLEDDVDLDVTTLQWSPLGLVRKNTGACWTWNYGGLVVEMTHGYTEVEAADWRDAVLSAANRLSIESAGYARQTAGPFTAAVFDPAPGTAFSVQEKAKLDPYRLEPLA